MKQIQWKSKVVDVAKIKKTPNNYKIKTALGQERLKTSLAKFGLAGTVVCNTDLTLIDGNSRLEQAMEKKLKKIEVSVPNRKLTPQEFKEMSAMFDFAKAGEVDIERIQGDIGTTKDFYKNWGIEPPFKSLGAAAEIKTTLSKNGKGGAQKSENVKEAEPVSDYTMVQLFFDQEQEPLFRKLEAKLMAKFKTLNTTETVLAAYKSLVK